jgi:hypothetical protein
MNYLYILEDGTPLLGPKPTEEDKESIDSGILSIINMQTGKELTAQGEWIDLDVIKVNQ